MSHDAATLCEALEELCAASRELSSSLAVMTDWTLANETQCVLVQHTLSMQIELNAAKLLERAKLLPRSDETPPSTPSLPLPSEKDRAPW